MRPPCFLVNIPENFEAGKVRYNILNWCKITSDMNILDIVTGINIPFDEFSVQCVIPRPIKVSDVENALIQREINSLLFKGVLEETSYSADSYISNIFTRKKKDNSVRLILNLKRLNTHIESKHFKMETLKSAITLIKPNVFFCSCDLKDAYYSLNIQEDSRKYLRFLWNGKCLQFTCLCNGLKIGPRYFTKLLKCVLAELRKMGFVNTGYIDDTLLQGDTYYDCEKNVIKTLTLFDSLGFTVHPAKSVFVPTQVIEFLGFILNSIDMTVSLSLDKSKKIVAFCMEILSADICTLRQLSQLIGKLVACTPSVPHAAVYHKRLEIFRTLMLRKCKGDYNSLIKLSGECLEDIQWWIDNVSLMKKPIYQRDPEIVIFTDASLSGWGGYLLDSTSTGGQWSPEESENHINYLELRAVLLSLQSFCRFMDNKHIRIRSDNTVTVICINKQGSTKVNLNNMTRNIWLFAIQRTLWLTAEHIPGECNQQADRESRKFNIDTEWKLKRSVFLQITDIFGRPDIDLFANRINSQLERYYSWRPDPSAQAIDAFRQSWTGQLNYIFCPFSVIGLALQKIEQELAEAILIAPVWPTQAWFPKLLQLTMDCPLLLPVKKDLLTVPDKTLVHPLLKRLHLAVFRISGKICKSVDFRKKLSILSCTHGEIVRTGNMGVISQNGCVFVTNGIMIPFHQMSAVC